MSASQEESATDHQWSEQELAEKLGLKPRIAVGEGDRKVDLIRNPITFSEGELSYELPPPQLGEHSDEIRKWLKETQG